MPILRKKPAAPDLEFVRNDLKQAWKYLVRAYNSAENEGDPEIATEIADMIVKVSQQLEFCESMTA